MLYLRINIVSKSYSLNRAASPAEAEKDIKITNIYSVNVNSAHITVCLTFLKMSHCEICAAETQCVDYKALTLIVSNENVVKFFGFP